MNFSPSKPAVFLRASIQSVSCLFLPYISHLSEFPEIEKESITIISVSARNPSLFICIHVAIVPPVSAHLIEELGIRF